MFKQLKQMQNMSIIYISPRIKVVEVVAQNVLCEASSQEPQGTTSIESYGEESVGW